MNQKLFLLALVPLLIFQGCSDDEMSPKMEETGSYLYRIDGGNSTWEYLTSEETVTPPIVQMRNGNSAHTHGDFDLGATIADWSGTQNNGGTHGSATLTIQTRTFTLETECVMVEGNEAVYGGTITAIEGFGFPPIDVGDIAYFKVFDNGQSNNAPADQLNGLVRFSKVSRCDIWTPGSAAWPNELFPGYSLIIDIPEPGSAKVNN
jgi:hypothetical protein